MMLKKCNQLSHKCFVFKRLLVTALDPIYINNINKLYNIYYICNQCYHFLANSYLWKKNFFSKPINFLFSNISFLCWGTGYKVTPLKGVEI